jgi:hypothetical protein
MIRSISLSLSLVLAAATVVATTPHSDFKVTLSSVPTNHSARRARLAAPTSQPLIDYFNGTDLQWYGNVSGISAFTLRHGHDS